MINGNNISNPQLLDLFKTSQASKQDALLKAFELGRAASTPVQTTAPFQATSAASAQSAPFATSTAASAATTPNASANYPNVGSKLTGGQGSIRLGDLAKKFESDAGADKLFNTAELKAIGFPESSALALGRNGGIKFSDILDILDPKATGGGWRREITPQGIDEAMKGLIDQKGGPRATTDLAANKPMSANDFAGLVNHTNGPDL